MKKLSGMVLLLFLNSAGAEAAGFLLSVKDHRLSARIEQAALADVLDELANQARLKVEYRGSGGDEAVSATFEDLPLQEGIRLLLGDRNYTVTYGRAGPAEPLLPVELRIIGGGGSGPITKGPTRPTAVGPKSVGGTSPEDLAREALQASDPKARIAALKKLVEQGVAPGKDATLVPTTVSGAFKDDDAEVRREALTLVQRSGVPVEAALLDMARHDPKTELRGQAWDEIVDLSESTAAAMEQLKLARQDPDAGIRAWAERKMAQLAEEEE